MNKKKIITISGKLGSGKSTTAKMVANILGYKHYSTGDFMREIATKRNISLAELSKIAENDSVIDKELDDKNIEIGNKDSVVLDSRLGFYFIPNSFKVFLELDEDTASKRILEDRLVNPNRHTEANGSFNNTESIKEKIILRLESEKKRYFDLYNIKDHTDHNYFDLIINTRDVQVEEVSRIIIEHYKEWLNK